MISRHLAACRLAYPDLLQCIEERTVDLYESATSDGFLRAFASILESFALLHGFIPNQLLWICPEIMLVGNGLYKHTAPGNAQDISAHIKVCFAMILFEHYDEAGPILKQLRSAMARSFSANSNRATSSWPPNLALACASVSPTCASSGSV